MTETRKRPGTSATGSTTCARTGRKARAWARNGPPAGSRAYDDRPVDMDAIARGEDSDDSPRGTPVHTPKINYASNVPVMDPTSSTSSISEDPREETKQPAKEATVPLRPAYAPQFAAPAAGGPNSLAMSADELAKQRAQREEARKEAGVAKPIEIFFDDDDEVDGAAANGGHHGGEEEAVEMFAAGVNVASPTRDLGVESARRKAADEEPPDEYWFEERGVLPPKVGDMVPDWAVDSSGNMPGQRRCRLRPRRRLPSQV
jgi:hypothetical protein